MMNKSSGIYFFDNNCYHIDLARWPSFLFGIFITNQEESYDFRIQQEFENMISIGKVAGSLWY